MKDDEYAALLENIREFGYDKRLPIYTYQGKILDGWQRYRACVDLGIAPVFKKFMGDDIAAIYFVVRANTRRNVSQSQLAAILVDGECSVNNMELNKPKKRKPVDHSRETLSRLAKIYNTNREYVRMAKKLKAQAPLLYAAVESKEKSLLVAYKEYRMGTVMKGKSDG